MVWGSFGTLNNGKSAKENNFSFSYRGEVMKELLKIKDLRVNFDQAQGQLRALRGIDLEIMPNEILCIVGESGCGKSVLCKTIMGLLCREGKIMDGHIFYEGRDLSKQVGRRIVPSDFGLILQDPLTALDPKMKIGRQMEEVLKTHFPTMKKKERKERIEHILEDVGIDRPLLRMEQYPHMLSGGMRQRVVIATALLKKPKILFADEPTTALDPIVSKKILTLLAGLAKQKEMSIVLVVHDLGIAYHFADRIAVMYAGKIVELATNKELFEDARHPYTKALFSSLPENNKGSSRLCTLKGSAPMLYEDIEYDAFASRNPNACEKDHIRQAPLTRISDTHYAAIWQEDDHE